MEWLTKVWDAVSGLVVDHWLKFLFSTVVFLLTTGYGLVLAWHALRNRTFYRRFHFSLNLIENGKLLIRTLDEQDAGHVLLDNSSAINGVLSAAKKTTEENPFLELEPDLNWLTLNSALNELARIVPSHGLFLRDWGHAVETHTYVLGLTCEKDKDVRIRKVRLMMIREKLLVEIGESKVAAPKFEQDSHSVRWKTLKKMAELYAKQPKRFMKFEVSLPQYGTATVPKPVEKQELLTAKA